MTTPIPLPDSFKFIELMKRDGAETIYEWWKMRGKSHER